MRDAGEIERAVTAFAREPNGGLVVTTSALAQIHRDLIIKLAARYRFPAIYPYRLFVTSGGLMCYAPRSSSSIAARLLTSIAFSGARSLPICPCNNPASTIWSSISGPPRRSASVPPTLLARADEVIE